MSMKNKIKNFFYLEEELEEEITQAPIQQQQPVQQQQPIHSVKPKKTIKERKASIHEIVPQSTATPNNIVSLQAAMSSKGAKVVLIEPRVYAEAQDIAEHLKNKRAAIVNLQRIEREQGKRIIDFLSGTVYALAGDIQRIGKDIFLCTPDNVEVTGEITNFILDDN
ncbi:cell division protein SepF [Lysinibacillus fusiformis]|uniref:Cell division protein SepF n=4 Tax=Lysinibacillus TaxID=400634 RepID=A0A1H9DJT5_9BACI|nr:MULTISPECIES: cell division protein SepF [Lysinibacillus]MBE5085039.1 cell division protein SepF [Bacillus thuringiensis]AJK89077.1 cell division protein SepF [Lysinibacillus fusiformis]AMO34723.1 cell division protein SepF [Lysinibacillus sphaericus]AMR90161.1 cell division protein SepF [Lysinibacillus sphaericus]ANA44210.1 cell division protein SepF [Lysinibacillus sphaericus]